jgi:hypothetical protein
MAVDLTLKKVHEILSDVSPDKVFYLESGKYVRNLHELLDALEFMEEDVFNHHVSNEKNDFYNWILDAIKDDILAEKIKKETERARFLELIEKRIEELENVDNAFSKKENTETEPVNEELSAEEPVKEELISDESIREEINKAIEQVKEPKKKHKPGGFFAFLLGFLLGVVIGLLAAKFLFYLI